MISVVIPLRYNPKRKYDGETTENLNSKLCIDSLLSQSTISEVIIVNHTPEYVSDIDPQIDFLKKEYKENDKVKVMDLRHGDFYFNQSWLINIGIKNTSSPFFMRVDIDCILDPNFSKMFMESFLNYLSKDYFISGSLYGHSDNKMNWIGFDYNKSFYNFLKLLPKRISNSHIIVNKSKIIEINGYDERFEVWGGEDEDVERRLKSIGLKQLNDKFNLIHQDHSFQSFGSGLISEKEEMKKKEIWNYLSDTNIIRNKQKWGEIDSPCNSDYISGAKK